MSASFSRLGGPLSLVLLLSGCATAIHQPLTAEAKQQVRSADVVIGIPQQEMAAQIKESNMTAAAGGGLLFALIDAGVNSYRSGNAEDAVRPLRDALISYSFDENLRVRMDNRLGAVPGMGIGNSKVTKDVSEANYNAIYQASSKDAVLITNASYTMNVDFSSVVVNATALLYPKSSGLKASANLSDADLRDLPVKNAIYRDTVVFTCTLPLRSKTLEVNRDAWTANNGALLSGALNLGADEIARVISADIQQTTAQGANEPFLVNGPGDIQRSRQKAGTVQISTRATPEMLAAKPVPVIIAAVAAAPVPAYTPAPVPAPAPVAPVTPATAPVAAQPAASVPTGNQQALQIATILREQPQSTAKAVVTLSAGSFIQKMGGLSNADGEWAFVKSATGQHGWINVTSGTTATP